MSDIVDTELLVNCTILAVRRFGLNTIVNSSLLSSLNRSEVINLLSGIIENKDNLDNINDAKDFLTECLFPSPTRPYELPWEQKTIWAIIFGMMLFVAIAGNCIVLWIVAGHRSMRTVTNYFLLNLSIADLLMSSLNCVFNFIFMLNSDWPFGSIYCTINNFMANVTVSTSVFTLVAISLDRYFAIVHPLKRRTSRRKVRIILLLIWVISCLLAAPCLLYSSTMTKRYYNGKSRTVCFMLWPDGRYPTSISDYAYNIIILILTYGIPMVVMLICYTLMGRVLWGSRSIGENIDRQMESMKSKRKVVRMFIAIVLIFAICWLPYHMFFIYAYHNNDITSAKYVQHMYLGFYWLAMSNAMVNPIIYYWMNKRFRLYFQRIICCCCYGAVNHKTDSPNLIANKNSFQKSIKVEGKNIWKRSTMETQIQVAQTSLRERITMDKTPNKVVVDCIQEKAKIDSSPVYISTKSGTDQQRIIIKCISCDEDNKYGKDIQGKNEKDGKDTL
ncbi:tachykinin-like peptides receptor 86C [Bactrocera neohumeralis]|uniref:tachykinin-like peptides receptor 86C n=1 Tax=Bactrocera neohumeralis TaxID=98809 RepID=UPI002165F51E|nr:tachykinin-like peptides receptor 86C [Bactrocera neohumeralis]